MKHAKTSQSASREYRCLECGTDLSYGRKGRKFCSDKCKNDWHNRENHLARTVHLTIISSLNRNYEVLMRINRMGMPSVNLEDLVKMGFNPAIFTGHRIIKGHNQYSCFEFDYYLSTNRISHIERNIP